MLIYVKENATKCIREKENEIKIENFNYISFIINKM